MKSYRTLALKELLSQKVTSILILIAVVLSTMMTTIVGQSIGVLSAMREQQAIAIGGNRYATFLQMNADQLHALEQDERLSYVGKSIYMGSLELSPSLTLGLMEYWDDTAAIYPSSTSVEEGRLPEAPMEIALSEDILKYLGFEGGIGDKITLSLQKNLRHNIADSYSYTAEFVLTGILKNNYLGSVSYTHLDVYKRQLQDKLVEYAYRQLSGEKAPTFHKLLFVYAEDTSAEVLRAAMLQKGFDLILVSSIWEAKRRIFEDKEIELILCDLELPDGTAMELFHTLRRVAGMFQMKNPPVRLLPFFILTENNDPATEYEYRHEGVNDYITAPVNIPELIRRVLFFVE